MARHEWPAPGQPLVYRVKEVSELLSLPASTVYDLVRRRSLESIRVGEGRKKLTLIPVSAVQEFLERHRVPARGCKKLSG